MANFPRICRNTMLRLLMIAMVVVLPEGLTGAREPRHCNFDVRKTYGVSDFLRCFGEIATRTAKSQEEGRNLGSGRSVLGSLFGNTQYDDYENTNDSDGHTSSSPAHYPQESTKQHQENSSWFSGLFRLPSIWDLLGMGSPEPPRRPPPPPQRPPLPAPETPVGFFGALNAISRHDDLQCVPRMICEMASGSRPGSLSYKQNSPEDMNFGQGAIYGLLSMFNSDAMSPLLSFARAAILGYTNRGQTALCYREYFRCPHNEDQLIDYLNNHNGGFFRLFGINGIGDYQEQLQQEQQQHHQYYQQQQQQQQQHQYQQAASQQHQQYKPSTSTTTNRPQQKPSNYQHQNYNPDLTDDYEEFELGNYDQYNTGNSQGKPWGLYYRSADQENEIPVRPHDSSAIESIRTGTGKFIIEAEDIGEQRSKGKDDNIMSRNFSPITAPEDDINYKLAPRKARWISHQPRFHTPYFSTYTGLLGRSYW